LTPSRDKRRNIFLLRGMLIFAVGGLLFLGGATRAGTSGILLLVVFALTDLALPFLPLRWLSTIRFELIVGALDVVFVATGISLAGLGMGPLPVSCLLILLVVALGNYTKQAVAGAATVGALHAWMVVGRGVGSSDGRGLALQVLFLCVVALYYGYLVDRLHGIRRREDAEVLERLELRTLLKILDMTTSSLDVRRVTQAIVNYINSVVPSVRCSLLLVDETHQRCFVLASHDDPSVDMLELDLVKYPEIREVIQTRKPVIVSDVGHDPLMAEVRTLLEELDFHSIMVLPLTFGEDLLGTLLLKTARAGQKFTQAELNFCNAVARASANALKNAMLHREVLAESARHRSTGEKLANLFNHSPELILTTDEHGRITEFNRGAERLLGYSRAEVLGQPCPMLLSAEQKDVLLAQVRSEDVVPNYPCGLRRKDGSELSAELTFSTLRDATGEAIGTVCIGRDVSALKSAQRQLLQAEKLSTIGNVLSGVAHELNNPLSVVLGYSQLLALRMSEDPAGEQLSKVHQSAMRCQKIVQNLLSFARARKPQREFLDFNGIIEKTLELKQYHLNVSNIEIVKELDPALPRTMLDSNQIQQVLLNLINNAEHAMVDSKEFGGRLIVRTRETDGEIRVDVVDNGEGMDSETQQRIFDPFFSTKQQRQGTGLGLSVSYGIVTEHGGRILVDSSPGGGATFTVMLPVREEIPASPAAEDQIAAAGGDSVATGQILVVDDEPMVRELLVDLLEDLGHQVDTARDGKEACEKVHGATFDVVITDVRMPRMSGIELYRELLATRPGIKNSILFITGDLIDNETVRFLAEVNPPVIAKPLEVQQVVDAVNRVLRTDDRA
jgi:PAS domain S-box-containing protein